MLRNYIIYSIYSFLIAWSNKTIVLCYDQDLYAKTTESMTLNSLRVPDKMKNVSGTLFPLSRNRT